MKIYVAGASAELERAESAIASLRAAGHEITHDWPAVIRRVRIEGGQKDSDLTDEERHGHAHDDLLAVERADVLWLLVPDAPTSGAWVELGFAIGLAWPDTATEGPRLVIVSGAKHRNALFCSMGDQAFDDDQAALDWLKNYRDQALADEKRAREAMS